MTLDPYEVWQEYEDSTRLYQLIYPPAWRFEKRTHGASVFFDVDTPRAVTVTTRENVSAVDLLALARRLLATRPKAQVQEQPRRIDMAGSAAVRTSYVETGPDGAMLWVVQLMVGPGFQLSASFSCPADLAELLAPEGVKVLESIVLTDHPPLGPEQFLEKVTGLAVRRMPNTQIEAAPDDFSLLIGQRTFRLDNLYLQYRHIPDELEVLVSRALDAFVNSVESRDQPVKYQQIRRKVMPVLRPRILRQLEKGADLAAAEFVNQTTINFVVDEAQTMRFICQSEICNWDMDIEQLQRDALQNLSKYRPDFNTQQITDADQVVAVIFNELDGYDASRLLLPELHSRLSKLLGPTFLVGVPNRDFLIAFRMDDAEFCRRIANQVRGDFASMDHAVSDRLFLVSADGVSGYDELDEWPEPDRQ